MERHDLEKPIGILSMQRVVNFGSVLQAYSLKELIRETTGREVFFLDVDTGDSCVSLKSIPESVDYEDVAAFPPGMIQKGKRWIISKLSSYNKRLIRLFADRELGVNEGHNITDFSYVVIGSDEVFNHRNNQVCLQFHGSVKNAEHVITYAASCGNAIFEDIQKEDCIKVKGALNNLESISVRDVATAHYVYELCGRCVTYHLDPVLVGNLRFVEHRPVWLKNYLLVYAYGHRIRTKIEIDAIQAFAKNNGLKTVAIGGSQFWTDLYIPVSPMRLLDYFFHADYVITDTFHGCIFSVINKKKFAVIVRKTNQEKIAGLLNDLGLEDHQLRKLDEIEKVLKKKIDYDHIDAVLAEEQIRTKTYLRSNLGVKL